ncbi:MAG TPA: hypothetical protein VFS05_04270 [Gemmatimonadaceae bacterium]|nr:hypothetical protein [Gemmatimonadaceae bacterium]
MAMDDYVDSKVGLAMVAGTVAATIFSPRTREVLHRGAVYGLAGVLRAGDAMSALARGIRRGMSGAGTAMVGAAEGEQPVAAARPATRRRRPVSRTRRRAAGEATSRA